MDPLDEALRTILICSLDSAAILKSLLKLKNDEFIFTKEIQVAQKTEQPARAAKATVCDPKFKAVYKE